jgi:hypothetical protein
MNVICKACGSSNEFEQPYAYHAGFANQGFLYNEAGTSTLVWSSFDPTYEKLIGQSHPWALTADQRAVLEEALSPAPSGGKWSFTNPPRCRSCGAPIGEPITSVISYLVYSGSMVLDADHIDRCLRQGGRHRHGVHAGVVEGLAGRVGRAIGNRFRLLQHALSLPYGTSKPSRKITSGVYSSALARTL